MKIAAETVPIVQNSILDKSEQAIQPVEVLIVVVEENSTEWTNWYTGIQDSKYTRPCPSTITEFVHVQWIIDKQWPSQSLPMRKDGAG